MADSGQASRSVDVTGMFDSDSPVQRIRVPKTSELVADHIRGQIVRGELREGDFLPPEGQLMASLGISRPTLREAFRILEAEALISVVRGSRSGARVHQPSVELVSRYAGYVLQAIGTDISDLYQARLAVEPQVVRWLADNPQKAAIERLRAACRHLRSLLEARKHDEFLEDINLFHGRLVEVTGNKTLTFMNRMLLNLVARHQRQHVVRNTRADQAKRLTAALKSYEKLINLIEAGQSEAAVRHWLLHLANAALSWTSGDEGKRVVDSIGQ